MSDGNDTTRAESEVEEFRNVPGHPRYRVSNLGRAQSFWTNARKKTAEWRDLSACWVGGPTGKYLTVALWKDGKPRNFALHTLVLMAFVGPRPPGMQCRHFPDRDATNNRLSNLRWGTAEENAADKTIQGSAIFGEKNHKAKLTEADVLTIRDRLANGARPTNIAREYGVSRAMIGYIRRRTNWAHI